MERHEEEEDNETVGTGDDYHELVENSDLFLRKLTHFHSAPNTNIIFPTVGGTVLDIHRLFVEVTYRGGLNKVIKDRKWKEVVSSFKLPTTVSSSFLLRKYYMALLYRFEQVYFFRKSAPIVQMSDVENLIPGVGSNVESTTSHLSAIKRIHPGASFVGVIDEKFDNGYVVSVNMGSDQLRGILYHITEKPQPSWDPGPHIPLSQKRRKTNLMLLDPSTPEPPREAHKFDPEHFATLEP